MRQEQNTDMAFTVRGYKTYLPLTLKDKRKGAQPKNIVEPLFPRYLFVELIEGHDEFHPVTKIPGVVSIVKFGGQPAPVPASVIRELQAREDEQGIHETQNDYQEGDAVRIKSGLFAGIEGIVKARNGEGRVLALMEIMGEQQVSLNRRDIEPITP